MAAIQVDESMSRFLAEQLIEVDKKETELALAGGQVVDNGVNRAIVDEVRDDRRVERGIIAVGTRRECGTSPGMGGHDQAVQHFSQGELLDLDESCAPGGDRRESFQ